MKKYAIGGIAIGIMQIIDSGILYLNNGACEGITFYFSGIEFLWAITSLVVAIRVKNLPTRYLALAFFLYNAFGWLTGMFFITETMTNIVPIWIVAFGGFFGLIYAASSAYVAKLP